MSLDEEERRLLEKEHEVGHQVKKRVTKAGFYIELLILTVLIAFNFIEVFASLPAELSYVETIIEWTAMGYLLYKASLSHIFFGMRLPFFDTALIIGYFSMVLNNFTHYISGVYEGMKGGEMVFDEELQSFVYEEISYHGHEVPQYLARFYGLIVENEPLVIMVGFLIGFCIMGVLAVFGARMIDIKSPSLLAGLGIRGEPDSFLGSLGRMMLFMIVFLGFFVVVFKIMMEWLAIAVHAPLIMIGFVIYFFSGHIRLTERIEKASEFGEQFYENFIELFKDKRTLLWGVAGMLALHLLTDIPNLIFPYVFGLSQTMYAGAFQDVLVWNVIIDAAQGMMIWDQLILWSGYLLNILGIFFLLAAPAYIWYHIYKESEFDMNPIFFFIFGASVTYYLLDPAFIVGMLESPTLIGVAMDFVAITPNLQNLLISLGVGLMFMTSSFLYLPEKIFVMLSMVAVQIFFLRHIYFYLLTSFNLYSQQVVAALTEGPLVNLLLMGSIGLFTLLFYTIGPLAYIVKTWR